MRGLRPYFESLPEPIYQVVLYAHAQFMKGLSPPLPRRFQPAAPAESPLRYRIADRINLVVKRIVPIHRVAKASLIFIVVNARRLKQLTRRVDAMRGVTARPGPFAATAARRVERAPRAPTMVPRTAGIVAGECSRAGRFVLSLRFTINRRSRWIHESIGSNACRSPIHAS